MVTYWAHNPKFRVRVSGPQLMGVTWVEPHEPLLHQESEGLEVAVTTLTRILRVSYSGLLYQPSKLRMRVRFSPPAQKEPFLTEVRLARMKGTLTSWE